MFKQCKQSFIKLKMQEYFSWYATFNLGNVDFIQTRGRSGINSLFTFTIFDSIVFGGTKTNCKYHVLNEDNFPFIQFHLNIHCYKVVTHVSDSGPDHCTCPHSNNNKPKKDNFFSV